MLHILAMWFNKGNQRHPPTGGNVKLKRQHAARAPLPLPNLMIRHTPQASVNDGIAELEAGFPAPSFINRDFGAEKKTSVPSARQCYPRRRPVSTTSSLVSARHILHGIHSMPAQPPFFGCDAADRMACRPTNIIKAL